MYIGSSVSRSPTIAAVAGAEISKGAGKAVKFDGSGNVVLCSAGTDAVIGVLILQTADTVAVGDSVTVQVDNIGKALAGGAITPGDFLAPTASGALIKASAGNNIIGQALSAGTENGFVEFIVCRGQVNA